MNPFTILQHVQSAYLTYVHIFQKFQNPAIRNWVAERVRQDTLLLPWSSSTSESQHIRAGGRLEGVVSGRIWWLTVLDHRRQRVGSTTRGRSLATKGPAGTGKTTAGVGRLLPLVDSGIPAGTILMFVNLEHRNTDENETTEEDAATRSVCSGFQWLQWFQDVGR